MVASIIIIIASVGLLTYWLRYTCLLLLNEEAPEAETTSPGFHFPSVRAQLRFGIQDAKFQDALDHDYAALTRLLDTTAVADIEARLLVWDYRLMRLWYGLAHAALPAHGKRALAEMADVLAALARKAQDGQAVEGA